MANNKFDHYYFIESNSKKVAELNDMIADEFPSYISRVTVLCGDANLELKKIINDIDWRYNRALMFLDPCATEVDWTTLELVAKTKAIDVWYLFPFSALNRMLKRKGNINPAWEACIDRLLGDHSWRNELYQEDPQLNLFDDHDIIKNASTEHLQSYIIDRLKTIFPAVASNPRILKNEKKSPLFLFCFAVASDNSKAQGLAMKIAGHILGPRK